MNPKLEEVGTAIERWLLDEGLSTKYQIGTANFDDIVETYTVELNSAETFEQAATVTTKAERMLELRYPGIMVMVIVGGPRLNA